LTWAVLGVSLAGTANVARAAAPHASRPHSSASNATWSVVGPDAGTVSALAGDPAAPGSLYAVVERGRSFGEVHSLFVTRDGGILWQLLPVAGATAGATSVIVVPGAVSTLFVGTVDHGLFSSTTGGEKWVSRNAGLPLDAEVGPVVGSPSLGRVLYASARSYSGSGIYRTRDGGRSWTRTAYSGYQPVAMAVDPTDPNVVYADNWKTVDGGRHWIYDLDLSSFGVNVTSLVVDPNHPERVYAGTRDTSEYSGPLFRSIDAGGSWDRVPNTPYIVATSLAFPAGRSSPLYVGTWAIDNRDPGGLYLLDTRTLAWQARTEGIRRGGFAMVIDPSNAAHVYFGSAGLGVVETIDQGRTWRPATTGLRGAPVAAVAAAPSDPNVVYVGTSSTAGGASVFRSSDDGATWSGPGEGLLQDGRVLSLAVDPVDPMRAFASMDQFCDACDQGALYRTTDGGATWNQVLDQSMQAIALFPSDHLRVLALARFTDRVWRSGDGGTTWQIGPLVGYRLWMSPAEAGTAYGSDGVHLARSTDWGSTWVKADGDIPSRRAFSDLAPDPRIAGVLVATLSHTVYSQTRYELFRTRDSGVHWTYLHDYFADPATLVADPARRDRFYAIFDRFASIGLYHALEWDPLPGLAAPAGDLAAAADGSALYAATTEGLAALALDGTEGGVR
jgi:photosystem II stability/assembly factor-like uncharacterized protein